MVYPWIYLDIPSFLKPDFSAGQCCWTHLMRTRLLVLKSVLLHAPPWQLCQGKRWSTKGSLPPLSRLTRPPCPLPLLLLVWQWQLPLYQATICRRPCCRRRHRRRRRRLLRRRLRRRRCFPHRRCRLRQLRWRWWRWLLYWLCCSREILAF